MSCEGGSERAMLEAGQGNHAGRLFRALGSGLAWLVLHPIRVPAVATPARLGLSYRSFRLSGSGVELAAWEIPCPGARAGLVLCHGHNNCRTQFLPLLRPLHQAGFHLLAFDFRAMGISGGDYCTYGLLEKQDVLAAGRWLRENAGISRLGLYGLSMGGATALLAAAEDPGVAAVVTEGAFACLEDMVEQRFHLLPRPLRAPLGRAVRARAEQWCGPVVRKVDPEAAVRQWRPRPLLVIHASRDRLVPPEHARRLAAAGGELAELWVIPGAHHTSCRRAARGEYEKRVAEFFRRHLLAEGGQ